MLLAIGIVHRYGDRKGKDLRLTMTTVPPRYKTLSTEFPPGQLIGVIGCSHRGGLEYSTGAKYENNVHRREQWQAR
jgi:hypothetical protein